MLHAIGRVERGGGVTVEIKQTDPKTKSMLTCCAVSSSWLCFDRKPPLENQSWPAEGDNETLRHLISSHKKKLKLN